MTPRPLAQRAEDNTAAPCPFCGARDLSYGLAPSKWFCGNCGENGIAEFRPRSNGRYPALPATMALAPADWEPA